MRVIIGWLIVAALVCLLVYIIVGNITRDAVLRKAIRRSEKWEGSSTSNTNGVREDYEKTVELNSAHLPSAEPPALSPDLTAVEEFIFETRFSFWVEGDSFAYNGGEFCSERRHIAKSEFDGDTLRFIELLNDDMDWFYSHRLGTFSEEARFLEDFLGKKYPMLSEKSRGRIVGTYCVNMR